jgi:signal transduction histidine kinase
MNMQLIDIGCTVTDMVGELADEYARRGLDIKLASTAENIFVNADYIQLRNVIINVLENSVKYKDAEQGAVSVRIEQCRAEDTMIEISLTDDGPGVPVDALDKLFDVFYRTDPSRNNEKKGSGLGPAIADKTIRRMGGTIHAELPKAKEPVSGRGLSIIINLPIIQDKG